MKPLSNRAESLPRSGIREVMELASHLDDVIHLEVGEPSFRTPDHIVQAACEAAREGFTQYTSNYGLPSLRRIVAGHYSNRWNSPVTADQVLVAAGGVNAIAVTTYAVADPGDEILIPDPGWPNYVSMAQLGGLVPIRYPLLPEDGYLPNPETIAALITSRTKVLVMTNPSNPTGVVFPPDTVEALVALAARHNLYVLSDEIYESLVFEGTHVPASSFDADGRVITVSGCSKTYAMTGWRLGYAIASPALIALAGGLMEPLVSCASSVSQKAAEAALTGPQSCVDEMRHAYARRRDMVRDRLAGSGLLPAVPSGAFYALIDLRQTGLTGRESSMALLEEERVAAAPGTTFGEVAEGMVRISLASSDEDVAEGCRRLLAFAARHRS